MLRNLLLIALSFTLFVNAAFVQRLMADTPKKATEKKPPESSNSPMDFTWSNMNMAWMKLSSDFEYSDARVKAYMQVMRPEKWKEVKNNEFKLRDETKVMLEKLKKLVDEFKADEEIVLKNAAVTLGKYDFELQGFPIESMTDTHYWYTGDQYTGILPSNFKVYFDNTKDFRIIKMGEKQAEEYIKSRTDGSGNVNRHTSATFRLKIKKLKDEKEGSFLADIQSMTIYHDDKKAKVLVELNAPAKPEDAKAKKDK